MVSSIYDCVQLGALAVVFLVLAFQKTTRVLLAEAVFLLAAAGLSIFCPSFAESQLILPFDNMHILLSGFAACWNMVMFVVFYFFFVRPSKDEDAMHGYITCRTIACGIRLIIVVLNQWRFAGIFKDTSLPMIMLLSLMWTLVLAYHLYQTGIPLPKRGHISPINLYIKIDIVLGLLLSLPDLLFPSYNKNLVSFPLDKLHEHMITAIAMGNLSATILGFYALGFRNITERKGYLCCRITVLLLMAALFAYTTLVKKMEMTKLDAAVMSLFLVPIIPTLTGLFLTSDKRSSSSGSGDYSLRAKRS